MTVTATDQPLGALEVVHLFHGAMPTGVSVSHSGGIFVNFPKWGDDVKFTVAEIRDGELVAYPSQACNDCNGTADPDVLVSVQSIVVDPADRLWILDTGSPMFEPTSPGGPKLVRVDLDCDEVAQTIVFPPMSHFPPAISTTCASICAVGAPGPPLSPTPPTRDAMG